MMTAGPTRRTVGLRTGGRSERVVASVLSATLAELARVGYATLRLEDVAERAGVAKTTVYRRFPTKTDLVHAAIRAIGEHDSALPDTGDVRRDILELLERSMKIFDTPQGRAIARLITTERAVDREIETVALRLKDEARERRAHLIERAKERGELPEDADPVLVMDTIFTFVMSRLVRFGERTDRTTCKRLIDLVITGAEHGGGGLAKTSAPKRPKRARRRS